MFRSLLFALILLGAGVWFPGTVSAQDTPPKLAQECIDANITTQADCDALLKKLGKLPHKPAKGEKPVPPLPKACLDAGITSKPDCDAYLAAQKAKPKTTTPASEAKPSVAAPVVNTPPPPPKLPKDCIAAGITTQADCDAFLAAQRAKAKSPSTSQPKPATENTNTPTATKPVKPTLPPDCIAAGLTTKADCDALHASEKAKANALKNKTPGGSPAGVPPGQPTTPPTPLSTSKTVTLPQDCLDAGLKTQADCDALHAMQKSKAHAAPVAPGKPLSTSPGTPKLAQDCIAAGITTKADCDAFHLAAQKAAKTAPATNGPAVLQPTEVVPVLPKGVTKAQIAPLLDSAKLAKTGAAPAAPAIPAPTTTTPPPTNDKAAQAALAAIVPPAIDKQPGTPISPTAKTAAVQLPSNVTIINQTIVNNITNNVVVNPPPPRPANPIGLSIGIVVQIGSGQLFVNSSGRDQYRIADQDRDRTYYEQLSGGRYRETIVRPDGSRIVTIYDRDGDVLRRSRFDPDGTEIVLAYFDYSTDPDLGQWRDPGDELPPLQLQVPVDDYVLDADQADEGQIQLFFARPPVEHLRRLYSISEVERSARLRDIVPRVELGDLTFDTGSADLGPDQIGALSNVAHAMLALLQQNPAETFLIEGHTDAVGSDASNLVLSDERAASVAQILTQAYHIPPENLATQGYGDHFLKIQTDGPERLNRRVVIRRITPLITAAAQ